MDRVVRKRQKRNKKARVSLNKEIIRIKKRNRFEMIKKNIYSLPLEIKIKIYQMAIQKHMYEWSFEHMKNNRKVLKFLTNTPSDYSDENKYSCWNLVIDGNNDDDNNHNDNNDNNHSYYYKHICHRNVKKTGQPGIRSIYIDDNITVLVFIIFCNRVHITYDNIRFISSISKFFYGTITANNCRIRFK